MKKWPYLTSDVKINDNKNPIAIVTLSSDIEFPKDKVGVYGKMKTENLGIERLVKNVITNNYIRHLIVCGEESRGHLSGQALVSFYKYGIDSEKRIINAKGPMPYLSNLDEKMIKRFKEQVKVHNLVGITDTKKILKRVNEILNKKNGPMKEDFKIKDEAREIKTDEIETGEAQITPPEINANTISDAWVKALKRVWNYGKELKEDQWKSKIREVHNLVVKIENPKKEPRNNENFPWQRKQLEEYSKEYFSPDKKGFSYSYGERLVAWVEDSFEEGRNAINQIEEIVIDELKKNKETRRAIAVTLNPRKDRKIQSPPCMILNQFLIRDNKLHATVYFRSHDIFGASLANWFAITKIMEYVCKKVKAKMGTLTSVSCSAHIYDRDFEKVKEIISSEKQTVKAKKHCFVSDPEGFFVISINGKEITAEHYLNLVKDGQHFLNCTITGKNAKEIYETITRLGLTSRMDHCAYLGQELQKAEYCLRNKISYVQDS